MTTLWLVAGGRDFTDRGFVFGCLDRMVSILGRPEMLMHGQCPTGADPLADEWALARRVHVLRVPALWGALGNAAGPTRNATMAHIADKMDARICITFPGGTGTEDMGRRAKQCRIQLAEIERQGVTWTPPLPELTMASSATTSGDA